MKDVQDIINNWHEAKKTGNLLKIKMAGNALVVALLSLALRRRLEANFDQRFLAKSKGQVNEV